MNKMTSKITKKKESKIDRSIITITTEKVKGIKNIGNSEPIIFIGMGTCGLAAGAQDTYNSLKNEIQKYKIKAKVIPVGCVGTCFAEPILDIKMPGKARLVYEKVTKNKIPEFINRTLQKGEIIDEWVMGQYKSEEDENYPNIIDINDYHYFKDQKKFVLSRCGIVNPESLEEYIAYENGYKALADVLEKFTQKKVIKEIITSGLRGRGGGGFPTGKKWEFGYNAKSEDDVKYIIMNADEGDPGAFMDRAILESDPYSSIEGMTIMGYAIGAQKGFIYCRAEYPLAIRNLTKAINVTREKGLLGKNIMGSNFSFDIEIKKGAGAFVCGEETALIESIEGKRGTPRIKPPYPAISGLWNRPTVVNNVETIAQLAKIINIGGKTFASWGTEGSKGTKVFALTGNIQYAGLVEVSMGTTIKDIIKIGGGIPDGKKFKAAQIGGPSGGCIPKSLIGTPIDYEKIKVTGAIMGSGGLVIMDESICMVDTARFFLDFIQEESCGKCIPCREGTRRMLETLQKLVVKPKSEKEVVDRMKSIMVLEKLAYVIQDTSLCGLGMTAPNPVISTLRYFRDEYEAHLYENKCPAKYCMGLLEFKIDLEKCIGCGLCKLNCPNDAILGEKKQPHYIVDDKCIKCGLCKTNCKFGAVYLE